MSEELRPNVIYAQHLFHGANSAVLKQVALHARVATTLSKIIADVLVVHQP